MYENLKPDCRQFRWDRPCAPHKRTGVTCPACSEYDPVRARVLVVKLAALGDVLRTTALLPAIHAAYPGCHVTWLTEPNALPLFERNPLVDLVLSTRDAGTAARLAVERYDAVLCPDADPEAVVLAAAAHARECRGYTRDAQGRLQALGPGAVHWFRMGISDPMKKANRETYQTLVARVLDLDPARVGEPFLAPAARDEAAAAAWRRGLPHPGPLVGLNTGAGGRWVHKQWTLEHQQRFLHEMTAVGAGVVLLGGPDERERHRQLLAGAPHLPVFDAGTSHSVGMFAALVGQCAVVVTGDTFALHVAVARRVPVVALFGPTSSAEIELYGRGEKIAPEQLDCLCCYLPVCDVRPHCQALIAPATVVSAVQRWLRSEPAPAGSRVTA